MDMRKIIFSVMTLIFSLTGSAQSYDERIADAMNRSDWFALDSIYNEAPKDSISPFLDVFSRCMIGNRLNRPDMSIPAFDTLFGNHAEELGLGNLINCSMMYSMDLSRIGENRQAADLLASILPSVQEYLDSAWTTAIRNSIDKYTALSKFIPYGISFENDSDGKIPFKIVPVGPKEKESVLMHLENSSINGAAADITFDTGAGVNVMSTSSAQEYGLIPLDASAVVAGHGIQSGYHAIAKEVKIGNITLTDVPFSVMDITSGNEEADKYVSSFMIVIGSETMLQLKELTLDFINREITVPRQAPARSLTPPDMCFSSGMNLLAKGAIHDNPMLMNIDSGDASYGSLNRKFFDNNKEYITAHATLDTVRSAGIGGIHISQCYNVPDMTLQLGGSKTVIPEITVGLEDTLPTTLDYECNLGLRSLMLFARIRFNMVDFTITTYPAHVSELVIPHCKIPDFKFTDRKISPLQSAGTVAMSVANGLLNADAPTAPDL